VVLSRAIHANVSTISGMTRGYRRRAVASLDLESDGKEIHLEIISKATDLGYRIGEIPATLCWPSGKKTAKRKASFKASQLIFSHLLFSFDEKPFLFLGGIGLALMILGVCVGLYAFALSVRGNAMAGRPMVFGAVLFLLLGIQMLLFSFLANQNRDIRKKITRLEAKVIALSDRKRR
jgi:hypothetical protein